VIQVVPLFEATLSLPDRKGSNATGSLVFEASIPPLGFTTYFVKEAALSEGNSDYHRSVLHILFQMPYLLFTPNHIM